MKVEFLEPVKHDGQSFSEGDTVTVSDAFGQYVCGLGWARDVAGKVDTAERNTSNVVICPENAAHVHTGDNVNG